MVVFNAESRNEQNRSNFVDKRFRDWLVEKKIKHRKSLLSEKGRCITGVRVLWSIRFDNNSSASEGQSADSYLFT